MTGRPPRDRGAERDDARSALGAWLAAKVTSRMSRKQLSALRTLHANDADGVVEYTREEKRTD